MKAALILRSLTVHLFWIVELWLLERGAFIRFENDAIKAKAFTDIPVTVKSALKCCARYENIGTYWASELTKSKPRREFHFKCRKEQAEYCWHSWIRGLAEYDAPLHLARDLSILSRESSFLAPSPSMKLSNMFSFINICLIGTQNARCRDFEGCTKICGTQQVNGQCQMVQEKMNI